jgi:Cd2+/Zn2+-exporting ATPase
LAAGEWVHRGLVLLVIACPCALVISTPVTIVCGMFRAARRGMLIKGGEFLEKAGRIQAIALDKTGTLTTGKPRVVSVEPIAGHAADEVLRVAAALEHHSEHPLAAAIVAEAAERGIDVETAEDCVALRGFGVRGTIAGETFLVGSSRLFEVEGQNRAKTDGSGTGDEYEKDSGTGVSPVLQSGLHEDRPDAGLTANLPNESTTQAWVGTRRSLWGVIHLADPPRHDAAAAIAELKQLGIRPIAVLSGDRRVVAQRIAGQLGIDEVYAELLPQDKVAKVRELAARHPRLAMVGDGVNDAPALAAAELGIALGSHSSDTALETADVVMMAPHVTRLPELIRLGRRCRQILRQNIVFALGLKGVVLVAAVAGVASMWIAVAADVGASLAVTFNAMRLASGAREPTCGESACPHCH